MHISSQINTFNYLGGKYSILPWLLPKLPNTRSFVDVFGGSMVVMLNREQSPIETYNDINHNVVNFFRQLRDNTDELMKLLYLTPYSRFEYESAFDLEEDTPLEQARKFFVRLRQSMFSVGSVKRRKSWKVSTVERRCVISEACTRYNNGVDGLWEIIDRLKQIQIENRDFEYVIKAYDHQDALFYCDPPYDEELTSGSNQYQNRFSAEDHVRLRDSLLNIKGMVAVSGYNSSFMLDLYKPELGFYITEGPKPKNPNKKHNKHTVECLFTNYDPNSLNTNTLF